MVREGGVSRLESMLRRYCCILSRKGAEWVVVCELRDRIVVQTGLAHFIQKYRIDIRERLGFSAAGFGRIIPSPVMT